MEAQPNSYCATIVMSDYTIVYYDVTKVALYLEDNSLQTCYLKYFGSIKFIQLLRNMLSTYEYWTIHIV